MLVRVVLKASSGCAHERRRLWRWFPDHWHTARRAQWCLWFLFYVFYTMESLCMTVMVGVELALHARSMDQRCLSYVCVVRT